MSHSSYHHTSGAEKRRLKKDGKERLDKVLFKVPRITHFFCRADDGDEHDVESECKDTTNTLLVENSVTTTSINLIVEQGEPGVESCTFQSTVFFPHTTDLAQWPENLTDEMRLYWVNRGNE